MELILEIIIYLLVVLGLITVCYTFFNKSKFIDQMVLNREDILENEENRYTYVRNKKEGERLVVNVRYKNIEEEELEKIKDAIQNGTYIDIMDIADEIKYIDSSQNSSKKKNK